MKEGLLERMARKLDLPAEIVAGLPKVEVSGCRDIYVQNHKGVLLYETNEIHINGGHVILKLRGQGFVLKAMNASELRIEGLIFGLDFEY